MRVLRVLAYPCQWSPRGWAGRGRNGLWGCLGALRDELTKHEKYEFNEVPRPLANDTKHELNEIDELSCRFLCWGRGVPLAVLPLSVGLLELPHVVMGGLMPP